MTPDVLSAKVIKRSTINEYYKQNWDAFYKKLTDENDLPGEDWKLVPPPYANVYASSRGFRLALNNDKLDDEILLKNVAIRRYICKHCGKEWIVADNRQEGLNIYER